MTATGTPRGSRPSDVWWIAVAVALAAFFSWRVVVAPALGLTFQWDDWDVLGRLATDPWPGRWLRPTDVHWTPLPFAYYELIWRVFGGSYAAFIVCCWASHVLAVTAIALLLRQWTGDARAAAVATAAFGVAVSYRFVLWCAVGSQNCLATGLIALALLAIDRSHEGKRVWFWVALASVGLAPFFWGGGAVAGPVVAVEILARSRRPRWRRFAAIVGVCFAWAVAYWVVRGLLYPGNSPPMTLNPRRMTLYAFEAIGLGFVQQVPMLPVRIEPVFAVILTLAWFGLVACLAYVLDDRARKRLLLAHVPLVAFVALLSLSRARSVEGHLLAATGSQYQYLAGVTWTGVVAIVVAALARRAPRVTLAASGVLVVALGWGHAREVAGDLRPFSPATRRALQAPEYAQALVAAAAGSTGPIYDVRLPPILSLVETRSSVAVAFLAPELHPRWTRARTPESLAPYAPYPVVLESLGDE